MCSIVKVQGRCLAYLYQVGVSNLYHYSVCDKHIHHHHLSVGTFPTFLLNRLRTYTSIHTPSIRPSIVLAILYSVSYLSLQQTYFRPPIFVLLQD